MIVMGGIVGSGIFMNPSVVAKRVHTPFLILGVWLAGGALAMLGAFIWAELATRLPGAGGQYLYLREAWHPAVAFVYGWVLLLVTQTGGMAAVAVTFALYYRRLTGVAWSDSAIAAAVLLGLTATNCFGGAPRPMGRGRDRDLDSRIRQPGYAARRARVLRNGARWAVLRACRPSLAAVGRAGVRDCAARDSGDRHRVLREIRRDPKLR